MVKVILILSILVIGWAGVYFYTDVLDRGTATAVGADRITPCPGIAVNDKGGGGGFQSLQGGGPCCPPTQLAPKSGCCP